MNRVIGLLAAGALLTGTTTAALAQDTSKTLNIYNWSDYIDETILADFTKETGIKIVYDVYDSNEQLETKLFAGGTGYDIVVPSQTNLERQINAGVHQKLDKSKIPNLEHMWPQIMTQVAKYDPDNLYAVPYMWGTTGIGYNVEMIKKRMPDAPVGSWKMVYDPEVVKNFADCGVMILDSPEDAMPSVLNYLGLDPDSKNPEDFKKAGEHMAKIKPYVRKFHSSEYISALAAGDICLAVGYSGDIIQAQARAEEAESGIEVAYVIPSEGAQMWFDSMVIPADAPHADAAHVFLNYLQQPEIIARATNYVAYANANLASQKFIDEAVINDPSIYPPEEVTARLFTVRTIQDPKIQRALTDVWTKIKSGT